MPHFLQAMEGLAGRADIRLTRFSVKIHVDDIAGVANACAMLLEAQSSLEHVEIYPWEAAGPFGQYLPRLRLLRKLKEQMIFNDETEIEVFCRNVAQGCPHLEAFDVDIETPTEDSPEVVLHFQTLKPLLQANQLKLLSVRYFFNILIRSDDVAAMGNAWPKMEHLRISSSTPISNLSTFA